MREAVLSPTQLYKIAFSTYEVRMSHWIDQPQLIRISDGATLFTLAGDSWSAFTVRWLDEQTVEMQVAKYPGRISATIQLQAATNQGTATTPFRSFSGTLQQVSRWLLDL